MANPHVSHDRIEQEVRAALATTLRKDPETIGMDASIVSDLHGSSLDFLDVNFRLENTFGVRLAGQLLLDHVEEELGEGTAIDRDNRVTPAAAELLRLHLGDLPGLAAGMYADEVAAVVTPRVVVDGVERILDTLPDLCPSCGSAWMSTDGAKVTCSACGGAASYPDGDELTKRWIHDVEREKQLFAGS
jgi:acyl carrier protein